MQQVADFTCPPMEQLFDVLIIVAVSFMIMQFRIQIEQSMRMRYYRLSEENCLSLSYEWISHFEESLQVAYAKIDRYTPRDWRRYNEGNDNGYTHGYNQGLLERHDNGWDEAKEYYQKIFERELREMKLQWQKECGNVEHFENMNEEYVEPELDDEWTCYGQKKDSKQTESMLQGCLSPSTQYNIY
jgi:hypothetical protein